LLGFPSSWWLGGWWRYLRLPGSWRLRGWTSCLSDRADSGRDCDSLGDDCSGLRLSGAVRDAGSARGDCGDGSRVDSRRSHLDRRGDRWGCHSGSGS
jgi:hypothetical protein